LTGTKKTRSSTQKKIVNAVKQKRERTGEPNKSQAQRVALLKSDVRIDLLPKEWEGIPVEQLPAGLHAKLLKEAKKEDPKTEIAKPFVHGHWARCRLKRCGDFIRLDKRKLYYPYGMLRHLNTRCKALSPEEKAKGEVHMVRNHTSKCQHASMNAICRLCRLTLRTNQTIYMPDTTITQRGLESRRHLQHVARR
jgi:hypothetical protein